MLSNIKNRFIELFQCNTNFFSDKRKEEIARKVCSRYARGNISLQNGLYITSKEIEQSRKKVESYVFQTSENA